jgi:hypothetical protein
VLAADCTGVYLFPRPLKRLRKRIYRNQSLEMINEWTSFQSHGFSPSVYLAGHTYKKINTRFDIEGRPIMSVRHAGLLADNRTPVGSVKIIYRIFYK